LSHQDEIHRRQSNRGPPPRLQNHSKHHGTWWAKESLQIPELGQFCFIGGFALLPGTRLNSTRTSVPVTDPDGVPINFLGRDEGFPTSSKSSSTSTKGQPGNRHLPIKIDSFSYWTDCWSRDSCRLKNRYPLPIRHHFSQRRNCFLFVRAGATSPA